MDREYYPSAHYVPNRAAEPYMNDGYAAMAVLRHEEERAVNERLRAESQRFTNMRGLEGTEERNCGDAWDRHDHGGDVEMG